MEKLGFKIKEFVKLNKFRPMEINPSIPLEFYQNCPACGLAFKAVCALTSIKYKNFLRIGCCDFCGHVAYMDRPTQSWISNFYSEEWGDQSFKNLEKRIDKAKRKVEMSQLMLKMNVTIRLANKFSEYKEVVVCEIGSGVGQSLRQLSELGFRNLVGVESSRAQVVVASQGYGMNVLFGDFESSLVQDQLKNIAPVRMFLAQHVLEHVTQPDSFFEKISCLQENGDLIILSVPNFAQEAAMGTLLYLPHLHSFTIKSLNMLLNNAGYQIIDDSLTTDQYINVVAKKTGQFPQSETKTGNYFDKAIMKLKSGLLLKKRLKNLSYYWSWPDYQNRCEKMVRGGSFKKWLWSTFSSQWRSTKLRCVLVEPLAIPFVSSPKIPIEVQFEDNIKLWVA
ncbi:MAG: methyltransferase domain-containing protein [bacterium]|nr:methyltransferase domain-containing protein [bacterium]